MNLGRLLCLLGLHKMERAPGNVRGLAGAHHCARGCGESWPEIKWPPPPPRPSAVFDLMGVSTRSLDIRDLAMTYAWRCDPVVRQAAENQREPDAEQHAVWLEERRGAAHIVMSYGVPIGMFTVLRAGEDAATIGYMVASEYRGAGYGRVVRQLALVMIRARAPQVKVLRSRIRVENVRSLVTALKAGAILTSVVDGFAVLEQKLQ